MKLRLDATPQELAEKGERLVESLGELFRSVNPDLAEALEKALPRKESELKFPVLREIQKKEEAEYERQMKLMVKDIGKVLDKSLQKSESASPDFVGGILNTEEEHYRKVKQALIERGYVDEDFEPGGPLHGFSTNELIDLARDKRGD